MFSSSFPRMLPPELPQPAPPVEAPKGDAAATADHTRRSELQSRRNSTIAGAVHRHGRGGHESRVADRVFVTVTRTTRTADDEGDTETTTVSEVQEQWTLPGFSSVDDDDASAAGIDTDGGGGGGGGGGEMAEVSSPVEAAEGAAAAERTGAAEAVKPAAATDAAKVGALDAQAGTGGTPAAGSVVRVEPVKPPHRLRPPRGGGVRQTLNVIGAGLAVAVGAIIAALIISHGAPQPADSAEDGSSAPPPSQTER